MVHREFDIGFLPTASNDPPAFALRARLRFSGCALSYVLCLALSYSWFF